MLRLYSDLVHLQAQLLSVQLLAIPNLLETIGSSIPLAADRNPLLVSGQDELCETFVNWLRNTKLETHVSAQLTRGHAPALLAFAATAALIREVPGFSGQRSTEHTYTSTFTSIFICDTTSADLASRPCQERRH